MLVLLALLACEGPPPETDLAGLTGPIGAPAEAGAVRAQATRPHGATSTRLEVYRADGTHFIVTDSGNPDRVALSPDGRQVAWVSGQTGIASLWVAETRQGASHRQLTNRGLESAPRVPGQAPDGFVPPPVDESLHFEGERLVWTGPDGMHDVVWR